MTTCFRESVGQMLSAWKIKRSMKPGSSMALPPVAEERPLSSEEEKRIRFWVLFWVRIFLFWKPGICFYRSYTLASVLRKRGVPLILNFGCRNWAETEGRVRAHCWLTLNDEPFEEKDNPKLTYSAQWTSSPENGIRYWIKP
ncbi:MAG: lasso peptide biosynthesis B2 protein [Candidatus Aureabacteria bacterium]|nr:lasso peptide biosynthesis B2 protein [Candidatus Auribacterota bacterium]